MTRILSALLVCLSASACQQAPRSRADVAAQVECRAQVDRTYAAQNRADLSRRDERDMPFAGSYLSGVTTRELGNRYGRENQMAACLSQNRAGPATSASTGPTFSPVQP